MKRAVTLIREIDRAAELLLRNYSQEEINAAFLKYERETNEGFNYITNNIYVDGEI